MNVLVTLHSVPRCVWGFLKEPSLHRLHFWAWNLRFKGWNSPWTLRNPEWSFRSHFDVVLLSLVSSWKIVSTEHRLVISCNSRRSGGLAMTSLQLLSFVSFLLSGRLVVTHPTSHRASVTRYLAKLVCSRTTQNSESRYLGINAKPPHIPPSSEERCFLRAFRSSDIELWIRRGFVQIRPPPSPSFQAWRRSQNESAHRLGSETRKFWVLYRYFSDQSTLELRIYPCRDFM